MPVPSGPPSERACPYCKIRHRVPRPIPSYRTEVVNVPLTVSQLNALYSLAVEFIQAGGGEGYDVDERCDECGRWSLIAWLDWLGWDVRRQEKSA